MKIALNYYGLPRILDNMLDIYNKFIKCENIEYHILYTTWNTENIERFVEIFPNAFIKQYDIPDMSEYNDIINNYSLDNTNPNKTIDHYFKGLFIKQKSIDTINDYEKEKSIEFDFIITLRTDTYIYDNHLNHFYDQIINNLQNNVYLAHGPKFDVHSQGAYPDTLFIANKICTIKMLSQLNNIKQCVLNDTFVFHPETSFGKHVTNMNLQPIILNIRAFPQQL